MPSALFGSAVSPITIYLDHLAEGIIHTSVEVHFSADRSRMGTLRDGSIQRTEVDACTKTTAPIGTGTYTTLDLQVAHSARHVGEIDPEDPLALGIIEGYFVHGHVDTRLVCSSDMEIGVTDSQTIIAGDHDRRAGTQQIGEVLPRVITVQFGVRDLLFAVGHLHHRCAHHDLMKVEITCGQCVHVLLRT